MEKLTIKSITSTDSKKDGTKLQGKFGPYWLVRADTHEHGTVTWFSKTAHTHKEGDVIEGNLEIKTSEVNGKSYTNKNFSFPKKEDISLERITKLEARLTRLELSTERIIEEKLAEFKINLTLTEKGVFMTDADYKKSQEPHPLIKSNDVGEIDSSSIPF